MGGKKQGHSERLFLVKRRDWRSCCLRKETQGAAVALCVGWSMKKE